MNIIQGFVTKDAFISNVPGRISDLFEISPNSLTFSREKGEYQHPSYRGDLLHTLVSKDQVTSEFITLSPSQVQQIFSVVETSLSWLETRLPPYSTADFLNYVTVSHSGAIADVKFGEFETYGGTTAPTWISWRTVVPEGEEATDIRIWLAEKSLRDTYPGYTNIVVPPFDNIDRFFGNYADVVGELARVTFQQSMERVQEVRGDYPPTFIRVYEFEYINRANRAQKTKTVWTVIVHGPAGDNIDTIRDSIADYISANTQRPMEEWYTIFPEIFQRTEFLAYPRWDKISIPNLTQSAALYSSMVDPAEFISFAKQKWNSVPDEFIENNLTALPFDYKAITVVFLNGQSNVIEKSNIREMFSDYIPVPNTSPDFGRMKPLTQGWLLKMIYLIHLAESATELSPLPSDVRRIRRNGLSYITSFYDGANYLVAIRNNDV